MSYPHSKVNKHVAEVNQLVVNRIEELGTPDFDSEFVFIREDGDLHALSLTEIAAMSETDRDDQVGLYANVVQMIERHNDKEDLPIVGLVHTAHVGWKEKMPHLMVVAMDDSGESIMTMFPVDEEKSTLGEAISGMGFSPHLDPWGYEAGRGISS